MVRTVTHEEIDNAEPDELQVVEVLPAQEYERIHLTGATSIPLAMLNRDTVEHLNPAKPVVVYCFDAY